MSDILILKSTLSLRNDLWSGSNDEDFHECLMLCIDICELILDILIKQVQITIAGILKRCSPFYDILEEGIYQDFENTEFSDLSPFR